MQNGKAVIGSSGSLFEEIECGEQSVILIQSGKNKALYVSDTYADTPIKVTDTFKDESNNHKWVYTKPTQCDMLVVTPM